MSKKEDIEEKSEKVEKVATGLGVLLSKAIGSIPIIRGFQKALSTLAEKTQPKRFKKSVNTARISKMSERVVSKKITDSTPVTEVVGISNKVAKYEHLSGEAVQIAVKSLARLNDRLDDDKNLQPTALAGIADRAVTIVTKLDTLIKASEGQARVTGSQDIADRARMLRAAAEELLKRGDGE